MKSDDRNLGMDRPISRRDVLLGMGALAASTFVPGRAFADEMLRLERAGGFGPSYPPGLTGLRGSHAGSFEVAHQLAREGRSDWTPFSSQTQTSTTSWSSVEASVGSRPRTSIEKNIRVRGS
jgi:hypothetical protein